MLNLTEEQRAEGCTLNLTGGSDCARIFCKARELLFTVSTCSKPCLCYAHVLSSKYWRFDRGRFARCAVYGSYRAARLLSTFLILSDRCFNNKAWGPQAKFVASDLLFLDADLYYELVDLSDFISK